MSAHPLARASRRQFQQRGPPRKEPPKRTPASPPSPKTPEQLADLKAVETMIGRCSVGDIMPKQGPFVTVGDTVAGSIEEVRAALDASGVNDVNARGGPGGNVTALMAAASTGHIHIGLGCPYDNDVDDFWCDWQ
jgi:hypothetical protein